MSKNTLFDADSEEEVTLKTENEYAKKYDMWRQKEELHKLEQKYGSKALNSDVSLSSDSEDESDEPPEVSEETETQFLKTLALLKTKDPRIYDANFKFFETEKKEVENKPEVKTLSFADSDDDDEDDGNIFKVEKAAEVTSTEKNSKPESKTEKIKDYLIGKAQHINNPAERDLAPLKALWSDPKLNEGEAFLRDYILNKKYLDDGDAGEAGDKIRDDADLEADEALVEEQGKFERAYNFRFEEPDEEYLKRFPRTMNYIRPKDDRRSRKRAEVRERKEEEKKKKMDEIARMKALKLKEIQEKIAKIKEVTGNQDLAFREEDMNSDFDPNEHDRRMKEIFDEEYYGEVDNEKPIFPDLDEELEIENWEKYEEEATENEPHCEDDEFNMDADYDPKQARLNLLEELQQNMTKKRRNRKKKSKLAELLTTEKPKYVPAVADKTYSEYMEEYYKMDCEDVIGGDLPTRFKYREVVPNDYGLTIEEILLADDKELTQWVPLKKIVRHRPENVEKGEVKMYKHKAADERLKKKVLPSLFKNLPVEPEIVVPVEASEKKKKKKKKKNKNKNLEEINDNEKDIESNNLDTSNPETAPTGEGTKKKKRKNVEATSEIETNVSSIANDDLVLKKKKNRGYHSAINNVPDNDRSNPDVTHNNDIIVQNGNATKKNKKEHKSEQNEIGNDVKIGMDHDKEKDKSLVDSSLGKTDEIVNCPGKSKKKKSVEENNPKQNLKRKLEDNNTSSDPVAKNKKKKKNKSSGNVNSTENIHQKKGFKTFKKNKQNNPKVANNPYSNLSDARLKAYGLNPKKYKGFMKYKKF